MCPAQIFGSHYPSSRAQLQVMGLFFYFFYEWCVHKTQKKVEVNLIHFHKKVNLNKKVCCAQNFGSDDQGQGHSQVL